MPNILEVNNLKVYYHTSKGPVKAVEDVSFSLVPGERMGLVGESGSGKSTIALALMKAHKYPASIENFIRNFSPLKINIFFPFSKNYNSMCISKKIS